MTASPLVRPTASPEPRPTVPPPVVTSVGDGLDLRAARRIVADLFVRNRTRYWAEFLASIGLAWLAFALVDTGELLSVRSVAAFAVSLIALYRSVVFIHEIAHFKAGEFRSFPIGWNLACGIPVLIPYFLYGNHWDHHARPTYGTDLDSEYLPSPERPVRSAAGLLVAAMLIPAVLTVRFAVLFPLSLVIPPLRDRMERQWSSLAIQVGYERERPTARERRSWYLQETACLAWIALLAVLVGTGVLGLTRVAVGYALIVGAQLVNTLRLLVAHRYRSDGDQLTLADQVADSLDYPDGTAPDLWAPIGLRWHAVHHLFPPLPYHSLKEAHQRLFAAGPAVVDLAGSRGRGMWPQLTELLRQGRRRKLERTAATP